MSLRIGALPLLVVGVGCLALGIVGFGMDRATWGWLLGAVGVALVLLGADQAHIRAGRRGRLRVRRTRSGLEVVGSRWSRAVDVAATLVFVAALVGALMDLAEVGGTPGLDAAGPVVVLAVLAALAFFTTLRVIGLRRRPTWLRLGPEGLEVSGPQGREAFAWADLTAVQAGPGLDDLVLVGHGESRVDVPVAELRSDPAAAARLLEHYRASDRDRAELGDDRALERIRTDRLL